MTNNPQYMEFFKDGPQNPVQEMKKCSFNRVESYFVPPGSSVRIIITQSLHVPFEGEFKKRNKFTGTVTVQKLTVKGGWQTEAGSTLTGFQSKKDAEEAAANLWIELSKEKKGPLSIYL